MLKVTFHENSEIDFDMFHIRVRGTDVELKAVLDVVQASVDAGYRTQNLLSHKVKVEESIADGCIDWCYGDIDNIHWHMERGNDGQVIIDMSSHKGDGDDYLDRTHNLPLAETFWIEPSAIIRAMLGKATH